MSESERPGCAPGLFAQVCDSVTNEGKLPAVMADWIDLAADELTRSEAPLEPSAARRVAVRVVSRLCREYGGSQAYIPRGEALDRAIRDAGIWGDYDGTTDGPHGVRAIARREGLTEIHVYRILERQRALHRARIATAL